jgi:hypothetical protein
MMAESCNSPVPIIWETKRDRYFLRDDSNLIDPEEGLFERYSLFRERPDPYKRLVVLTGPLLWAIKLSTEYIKKDRDEGYAL